MVIVVVSQDWNHRPGRILAGPAADGVSEIITKFPKTPPKNIKKYFPKLHTSSNSRYRFSPQFTQNVLAKLDPRDRKLTLDNFIVVSVQVRNKSLFSKTSFAKHFPKILFSKHVLSTLCASYLMKNCIAFYSHGN